MDNHLRMDLDFVGTVGNLDNMVERTSAWKPKTIKNKNKAKENVWSSLEFINVIKIL